MPDSWRLAVGTFLAVPVPPPRSLDRRTAGRAMLLAPLTTMPALLLWAVLAALVGRGWLGGLVAATLAIAGSALLSRGMHLDGLADTADGLSAGYDRRRSLEVMRRSDIGPSGVVAIVVVLLLDVACLVGLLGTRHGAVLTGTALVASRLAPAVACCGHAAARPDGLGHLVAGSVSAAGLACVSAAVVGVSAVAAGLNGIHWYAAVLVPLAGVLGAWVVTHRASGRLGGVTGDVIGAAIEASLGSALVVASVVALV